MARSVAALRMATLDEGVLVLRVEDLAAQIRDVNADLEETARAGGAHTARLHLLNNDRGWRDLPGLVRRIFRLLRVRALHVDDALDIRFGVAAMAEPRGDHVARALGQVERPAHVEELALRSSMLTGGGFERLEPFVRGLSRLDVSGNYLEDVALRLLSTWPAAASLEALHFAGNKPTARGIHALASGGDFPGLARLDLSSCKLGAASVRRLTDGALPALTELSLAKNPCGDEGAAALAEAPWSERLARLDLSACGIADAGARLLSNSPHLRSIGLLDLRGNALGDRGRKRLHDRFGVRVLIG